MIVIIDYDMGNVKSVQNMLAHIGHRSIISRNLEEIKLADKLILPGVGAFDTAMKHLHDFDLLDVLNEKVLDQKVPILGICLGLQLMAKSSEESMDNVKGLGWFDADVKHFDFSGMDEEVQRSPIPHMGWNGVNIKKDDALFSLMPEDPRFYFVHSYYISCNDNSDVLATSNYGFEFACAISQGNIMATQFHPEKSLKYGMKVLDNFANIGV